MVAGLGMELLFRHTARAQQHGAAVAASPAVHKSPVWDASLLRDFFYRFVAVLSGDAAIPVLDHRKNPSAIVGFVVAIKINTVNLVATGWALAHVNQEAFRA